MAASLAGELRAPEARRVGRALTSAAGSLVRRLLELAEAAAGAGRQDLAFFQVEDVAATAAAICRVGRRGLKALERGTVHFFDIVMPIGRRFRGLQ